ncbi:MAG: hypothetical protein JWL65_989 [Gammaproteobacteria bacterium]|nr:hypothetical protein [Gammaproteobacteria bacterium]
MEQQHNIARHLRSLPQEIRQPYDWMEFRRRASRQRTNDYAREGANKRKYAAIAAALFLVVVGVAAWVRVTRPGTPESIESDAISGRDGLVSARDAASVDSRVDAAERWLVSLPSEPIVVRVGTRAAVAGLEDRIAQLDDFLSAARVEGTQPAKLVAVEEQRARLVNSLVQVRYAETLASESR